MDVGGVMMHDASSVKASAPTPASAPKPAVAPAAKPVVEAEKPRSVHNLTEAVVEKKDKPQDKQQGNMPKEKEYLDKALEKINKSLVSFNREMKVSVHEKLNRIMVKVIDTEQNKVIREIPPEKVLDAFAVALELAGVLIDEKR